MCEILPILKALPSSPRTGSQVRNLICNRTVGPFSPREVNIVSESASESAKKRRKANSSARSRERENWRQTVAVQGDGPGEPMEKSERGCVIIESQIAQVRGWYLQTISVTLYSLHRCDPANRL